VQKWRGYGTLPVVFNMAKPVGGSDQHRTRAYGGNREVDAVAGLAKSNRLRARHIRHRFIDTGLRRQLRGAPVTLFPHFTHEAMASARERENETLFVATIANGAANRRDPAADGRC
jgi:hypothetical protein